MRCLRCGRALAEPKRKRRTALSRCADAPGIARSDHAGRATGAAARQAIAREISCAKPPIVTGQLWALFPRSFHSIGIQVAERFGGDMTEGQSRKRLAGKI